MVARPSGTDRWIVRVDYTFSKAATSTDDLDRPVGGRARSLQGISHSTNFGPEQTTLEWEVDSLPAARAALKALDHVPGVRRPRVSPVRPSTSRRPDEHQIRASDARAGRARCADCGGAIAVDQRNFFALEGVPPGSETTLVCGLCDLPMGWIILAEPPSPPGR